MIITWISIRLINAKTNIQMLPCDPLINSRLEEADGR
jgi:hypothetical protein